MAPAPTCRRPCAGLPSAAVAELPGWPGRDGKPRRLILPSDAAGAVVYTVAPAGSVRPIADADAVQLEAVTSDGRRLPWNPNAPKWTKHNFGTTGGGRVFTARTRARRRSVPGRIAV